MYLLIYHEVNLKGNQIMKMVTPKYLMLIGKNAFPGVTYESFLIDIINASEYFFRKHSITERYILVEKQSKGEDDAYTSSYQIDFKLLVNEEVMKARYINMPEIDYSKASQGFVFVKTKEKVCDIPDDNILEEIRNINIDKIKRDDYINNTQKSLVKNIKKNKNLFIYYPYEFYDYPYTSIGFAKILTDIFYKLLKYRDELVLEKDTFVCIKVNEKFLIYEWKDKKMILCDEVHQCLCTNYIGLKEYSVY